MNAYLGWKEILKLISVHVLFTHIHLTSHTSRSCLALSSASLCLLLSASFFCRAMFVDLRLALAVARASSNVRW